MNENTLRTLEEIFNHYHQIRLCLILHFYLQGLELILGQMS